MFTASSFSFPLPSQSPGLLLSPFSQTHFPFLHVCLLIFSISLSFSIISQNPGYSKLPSLLGPPTDFSDLLHHVQFARKMTQISGSKEVIWGQFSLQFIPHQSPHFPFLILPEFSFSSVLPSVFPKQFALCDLLLYLNVRYIHPTSADNHGHSKLIIKKFYKPITTQIILILHLMASHKQVFMDVITKMDLKDWTGMKFFL